MERLQELLKDMDVPERRRFDLHWLSRNLFIRNGQSSNYKEAFQIIKDILTGKIKE